MGLFDFFKRKKKNIATASNATKLDGSKTADIAKVDIKPTEKVAKVEGGLPENTSSKVNEVINSINKTKEFENILQKAAEQPEFRNEFYKRLLTEELLVISKDSELGEGSQKLEKDTKIHLVTLSDGSVPVFSSIPKIYDKGVIKEQISYVQIKGKDLFGMLKGMTLFLNPFSDYGKELLPNEIERILDGTIFIPTNSTQEIKKDTKIQIGVPSVYPKEIMDEMSKLFITLNIVKTAYIAWINVPSSGEPPHYIFALDVEGDFRSVVPQAGAIYEKYSDKSSYADFIKLENKGGLSDYFHNEATPFYQR